MTSNCRDFIANSPDLSPVDYHVLGALLESITSCNRI